MLWWLTAWETRLMGLLVAVVLAGLLRWRGGSLSGVAVFGANVLIAWLSFPFPLMATVAFVAGYGAPLYVSFGLLLLLAALGGAIAAISLGARPVRSSGFLMGTQVALVVCGVAVLVTGFLQLTGRLV
jgi:hypothetical protein